MRRRGFTYAVVVLLALVAFAPAAGAGLPGWLRTAHPDVQGIYAWASRTWIRSSTSRATAAASNWPGRTATTATATAT